jgi:hypothetical protein
MCRSSLEISFRVATGVARIAFSVFVAGVGKAAADPSLAEVDDADLHRVLLELASRIMQPLADGV